MPPRQEPPPLLRAAEAEFHQWLCQTSISDDIPPPVTEYYEVPSYVQKVKERFLGHPENFMEFLRILHKYSRGSTTKSEICSEMADVLRHHQDLYQEFKLILRVAEPPEEHEEPMVVDRQEEVAADPDANTDRAD